MSTSYSCIHVLHSPIGSHYQGVAKSHYCWLPLWSSSCCRTLRITIPICLQMFDVFWQHSCWIKIFEPSGMIHFICGYSTYMCSTRQMRSSNQLKFIFQLYLHLKLPLSPPWRCNEHSGRWWLDTTIRHVLIDCGRRPARGCRSFSWSTLEPDLAAKGSVVASIMLPIFGSRWTGVRSGVSRSSAHDDVGSF